MGCADPNQQRMLPAEHETPVETGGLESVTDENTSERPLEMFDYRRVPALADSAERQHGSAVEGVASHARHEQDLSLKLAPISIGTLAKQE